MRMILSFALCLGLLSMTETVARNSRPDPAADIDATVDENLWLEDITGDRALAWVRARNAQSQKVLEADPDFAALRNDLLAILDSEARIPYVEKIGDHFYNFWRDKKAVRGIWRRTTPESYRSANPTWETVLDLDALAASEHENWVWHGAKCLRPDYQRCLIALSRGGADADVTREFDLGTRSFVADGFVRPEAKGGLDWIDRDHVFVFTDFGAGSLTESGYPRIAKLWQRGTPLSAATTVYEGRTDDMYIAAMHDDTPGFERDFVHRTLAFYEDELYLREADGNLRKIEAPNSANKSVVREWLLLELREPWALDGRTYPAGALLVARLDDFMRGKRTFDVLFTPDAHSSLASFGVLKDHLWINVLEDVKNRIFVLTHTDDGWHKAPLQGAPAFGSLAIAAVDEHASNEYFLTVTDFLTPTTLMYGQIGAEPEPIKQLPAFFADEGLAISQHFATSKDGTRVPYFQVARGDLALDGDNPTLLYGYGGFEISLTPTYNASVGRGWLSQGGVYVVANIRGGGEYGPRWHQAALKANRNKAYEDFAAVAQDLIARKITRPARLGIQGGSNGGLLMGNMTVMYPELFGAVVCQVPLLDMRRYHRLLAGASWMAEYGDPDNPAEWAFLRRYSPYQNVKADAKYPPVLFTTSTRDDRVHPGHARKMMARMQAQGHDVLYYENIEGGHGGAANNVQAAYMQALAYTFLKQRLFAGR